MKHFILISIVLLINQISMAAKFKTTDFFENQSFETLATIQSEVALKNIFGVCGGSQKFKILSKKPTELWNNSIKQILYSSGHVLSISLEPTIKEQNFASSFVEYLTGPQEDFSEFNQKRAFKELVNLVQETEANQNVIFFKGFLSGEFDTSLRVLAFADFQLNEVLILTE